MQVKISNAEDDLFGRGLFRVSLDVTGEELDRVIDALSMLSGVAG